MLSGSSQGPSLSRDPYADIAKILPRLVRFVSMFVVTDVGTVDVRNPYIRTFVNPPTVVVGGTAHLPGGRVSSVNVNLYDANNERIGGFIGRFDVVLPEGDYTFQIVVSIARTDVDVQSPEHELLVMSKPVRIFDDYLKIPILYIGADRSYQAEAIRVGRSNVAGVILVAKAVVNRPVTNYEKEPYVVGPLAEVILRRVARVEPLHYNFATELANERAMDEFSGVKFFLSVGDIVTGVGTGDFIKYGNINYGGSYLAFNKGELNPGLYYMLASIPIADRAVLGFKVGSSLVDVRLMDIMSNWMVGGIDGEIYIDGRQFPIKASAVAGFVTSFAFCRDSKIAKYAYCVDVYDRLVDSITQVQVPDEVIAKIPACRSAYLNAINECKRKSGIVPKQVQLIGYWAFPSNVWFPWVDVYAHMVDRAYNYKLRLYVSLYTPFTDGVLRIAYHGRVTVKILPVSYDIETYMKYKHVWILDEENAAVYTASGRIVEVYKSEEECERWLGLSVVPMSEFRTMQAYVCPPAIQIPVLEIPLRYAKDGFMPIIFEYEPRYVDKADIRRILDVFTEEGFVTYGDICGYVGEVYTCERSLCKITTKCMNDLLIEWIYEVYRPAEWFYSMHILRDNGDGTYTGYLPTVDGSFVAQITEIDTAWGDKNVDVFRFLYADHVPYTSGKVPYLVIDEEYRFIRHEY